MLIAGVEGSLYIMSFRRRTGLFFDVYRLLALEKGTLFDGTYVKDYHTLTWLHRDSILLWLGEADDAVVCLRIGSNCLKPKLMLARSQFDLSA
jgi:hypothetical protein